MKGWVSQIPRMCDWALGQGRSLPGTVPGWETLPTFICSCNALQVTDQGDARLFGIADNLSSVRCRCFSKCHV